MRMSVLRAVRRQSPLARLQIEFGLGNASNFANPLRCNKAKLDDALALDGFRKRGRQAIPKRMDFIIAENAIARHASLHNDGTRARPADRNYRHQRVWTLHPVAVGDAPYSCGAFAVAWRKGAAAHRAYGPARLRQSSRQTAVF